MKLHTFYNKYTIMLGILSHHTPHSETEKVPKNLPPIQN